MWRLMAFGLSLAAGLLLSPVGFAAETCNTLFSMASDIDPDRAPGASATRADRYSLARTEWLTLCQAERAQNPRSGRIALVTARALLAFESEEESAMARDLLREAIMLGSIDALVDLAEGTPDGEAIPLLSRAAEAGHVEAMLIYGERLFPMDGYMKLRNGDFPPLSDKQRAASAEDIRMARRLNASAAEKGERQGTLRLAKMWDAGIGGEEDNTRAERLYRQVDSGYALFMIAEMYRTGELGPVEPTILRAKYQASADRGQIDPLDELGAMLEQGLGGPADPSKARRLYEGSLEYCHGGIADRLAMLLMRGQGGPVDATRAAQMHLRAISCHNPPYMAIPVIRKAPGSINRETWRAIQGLLAEEGLYSGPLDGILGARTAAAVAAYWKSSVR